LPGNLKFFTDTIRRSVSLKPSGDKKRADEEQGAPQKQARSDSISLSYVLKAFTVRGINCCFAKGLADSFYQICVLPILDGKKAVEVEGPEQKGRTNCGSWIALIIAPGDIIWDGSNEDGKLLNDRLLDGNLADRAPANRKRHNRHRFGMTKFKSPRDADHFQTCLIEVGMRRITDIWTSNVHEAAEACRAFEEMIHGSIHRSPNSRSDYWRRGVNDDLLSIYKLQKRLESLEANLFNNITNHEQGIWSKFRKARPGRRLEQLEQEEDGRKKRGRKGEAQKSSQTENNKDDKDALERQRLEFLLHGCLDRHSDRLCGQRKKLRQKIDDLQALRQLVSLYPSNL
jgi:hypothetical protein